LPTRCNTTHTRGSDTSPLATMRWTSPRASRTAAGFPAEPFVSPVRCGACARSAAASESGAAVTSALPMHARALKRELPKIFRTKLFEIALELFGAAHVCVARRRDEVRPAVGPGLGRGFAGRGFVRAGSRRLVFREQLLGGEDRRVETHRDRDAVRRTRVHHMQHVVPFEMHPREERAV